MGRQHRILLYLLNEDVSSENSTNINHQKASVIMKLEKKYREIKNSKKSCTKKDKERIKFKRF